MSARQRRAKDRRRKRHVLAPAALTGALATSLAIGGSGHGVGSAKAASGKAGTTFTPQFFAAEIKNIFDGSQGSSPGSFAEVNGTMFFAADDGSTGRELWKTDGTPEGTTLVKDIDPGATGSNPSDLTNVNGTLFFTADNGANGKELWKSDGTAAGTVLVKDIATAFGYNPSLSSDPSDLTNVNGTLFFSANDDATGSELWKSDGTAAGTVRVKDINATGYYYTYGSDPTGLTNVNGTLFFSANDGSTGYQLWKSDGTASGTVEVKDIGQGGSDPIDLTNVNGTLFFSADDHETGYHVYSTGRELWKSDGTSAGTVLVKEINPANLNYYSSCTYHGSYPQDLTNVGGTLFFAATDCVKGYELWKSDGTAAGTVMVKDVNPNGRYSYYGYTNSSDPANLTNVNGTLFFSANDGSDGYEPWKSDGTDAGTVLIDDVNSGAYGSDPGNFTNVNGILFFTADLPTTGHELWESDGTANGTGLIKDINPGVGSNPSGLTSFDGDLIFAADDGVTGPELWEAGVGSPPPDPTSAGVSCAPATVQAGSASTCTVTVTSVSGATVPTGTVSFAAGPATGSFGTTSCALGASGVATASCQVTFTPAAAGGYTITGSYGGDAEHPASSGAGSVTATALPPPPVDTTSSGVSCSPSSVTAGSPANCTVTVTDTASSGALTPTGSVAFSAGPSTGSFGSPSCTLGATGATTASCNVTFTPSAAGGYTVTTSYGGDSRHHPSSGLGSLTATAKPAGGLGKAAVGRITISGTTARVRITCTGETGQRCPVTLRLSTRTRKKTVALGRGARTFAAGQKVAVRISLNAEGKRLLAKLHTLRTSLVVREKTTKIATRKLSFKSPKKKH